MLLIIHPGDSVAEPRTFDFRRRDEARCFGRIRLRSDCQSRVADRALRDLLTEIGQSRVGFGNAPQPRQSFADDTVATAARNWVATDDLPPGPEPLADPSHLAAEQLGLPSCVRHL